MIKIETALRCSQYQGSHSGAFCGERATSGIMIASDYGSWELVPVCQKHFHEAMEDRKIGEQPVLMTQPSRPSLQAAARR